MDSNYYSSNDSNNSSILPPNEKPPQNKVVMIVICWLLGSFGVHRFMMGYSNWWLMLITLGGCGIWTLVDLIRIAIGDMKMADGRDLKEG